METYVTPPCYFCGKTGHMMLTADECSALEAGMRIVWATPDRNWREREQILNGTHEACYEEARLAFHEEETAA